MIARIQGVKNSNKNENKFYLMPYIVGQKPHFIEKTISIDRAVVKTEENCYQPGEYLIPVLEVELEKLNAPKSIKKLEKFKHLYSNLKSEGNVIHIPLSEEWGKKFKPIYLGQLAHFEIIDNKESADYGKASFQDLVEYKNKTEDK